MLEINNIRDWNALPGRTPRPQKAAEQIASQVDKVVLGQPSFSTRVRHLRTAMKPDFWEPASETLALLAIKPEIAATLLGQPLATHESSDNQVRQVGMIAYFDTPQEVDKFQDTLKDWEANFQLFGHHSRLIKIQADHDPGRS
jgi:predicted oxidoreductase (fatty acid repression mutant protein)